MEGGISKYQMIAWVKINRHLLARVSVPRILEYKFTGISTYLGHSKEGNMFIANYLSSRLKN